MSVNETNTAVIIGSGGGIGKALKEELLSENIYREIICFSKNNDILLDITDESQILEATNKLKKDNTKINLLINAVGYLHDANFFPEKKISEISNNYLLNSFKLNSIIFSPHGMPLDLLDRLLIITTTPYKEKEIA